MSWGRKLLHILDTKTFFKSKLPSFNDPHLLFFLFQKKLTDECFFSLAHRQLTSENICVQKVDKAAGWKHILVKIILQHMGDVQVFTDGDTTLKKYQINRSLNDKLCHYCPTTIVKIFESSFLNSAQLAHDCHFGIRLEILNCSVGISGQKQILTNHYVWIQEAGMCFPEQLWAY